MTNELLLHEQTLKAVQDFLGKPSHALIIEGRAGTGKQHLANYISSQLLVIDLEHLSAYPHLLLIEPGVSLISINDIRQIQQFLKLKTTGQQTIRRILIINQAESMTIEAQNAFLKILEEPPVDTVLLILTTQQIKLLPTIRSRAPSLAIRPVDKQQIINYFRKQGFEIEAITQALHIADARIGLIASLLNDDNSSQKLEHIKTAKKILLMSKFERLSKVDELTKNKEGLPELLDALSIICRVALKQAINNEKGSQSKQWHQKLNLLTYAEKNITLNPNTKLLLTDLLLNL